MSNLLIVMTGGLQADGQVQPWVQTRLDRAAQLYQEKQCNILCTGGGTYHKQPVIQANGHVLHASTACAQYLIQQGVDPEHIRREWSSYDTISSVYFSLLLHVLPVPWKSVTVITSEFHMPRVQLLFSWLCGMYKTPPFVFITVPDDCIPENILVQRCVREEESIKKISQWFPGSPYSFYRWMYQSHRWFSCKYLDSSA